MPTMISMRRPSHPWKREVAFRMARMGFGAEEICQTAEISRETLKNWLHKAGKQLAPASPREAVHLADFKQRGVTRAHGGRVTPPEDAVEAYEKMKRSIVAEARRNFPVATERQWTPAEIRLAYLKKRHVHAKAKLKAKTEGYGAIRSRLSHEYWEKKRLQVPLD